MPTRVLDLGQGFEVDVVRLFESSGELAPFVALSHCWGTSHRLMLTRETFDKVKGGIALADLPQTFRDAVKITKKLGLRYLWIDSLCILQDDDEDWEREASRMADVYAKSYITIAASASRDDSSGIFPTWQARSTHLAVSPDAMSLRRSPMYGNAAPLVQLRNQGEVHYLARSAFALSDAIAGPQSELCVSIEWMPSSMTSKPQLYCIPLFGCPLDPPGSQPLNSRGWTLQERLLSPRTLHYCIDQIYWECNICMLSEDGGRIRTDKYNFTEILETQQLPLEKHGICGAGPGLSLIEGYTIDDSVGRWRGGWLSTIEDYSAREFSHTADKLPALSGLATALTKATGDAYYAGLWRNHILEDLHWRVYARNEKRIQVPGGFAHVLGEQLCTAMRPAEYRAPTWSWASIDAKIKFIPLDFERILTEFAGCDVTPAGKDRFGRASEGWIKLKVSHKAPELRLSFARGYLTLILGPIEADIAGRSRFPT